MGHEASPPMMSTGSSCQIFFGRARSGVTSRIISEVKTLLPELPPASVLWIAPSYRAAQAVREQLVDSGVGATLAFWIGTFDQLACRILAASGEAFVPLSRPLQWELLRLMVQEAATEGLLRFWAPIAHTRGLIDRVYHWVARCERAKVTPETIRQKTEGQLTPQLSDFVLIFERYLDATSTRGWYDAESRLWKAAEVLERQDPLPFLQAKVLVADGFADFAPAQLTLIGALARRMDNVFIGLPLDEGRDDLFAKPKRTVQALKKTLSGLKASRHSVAVDEIAVGTEPFFEARGLAHLERYLFTLPGEAPAADGAEGVEIRVGANVQQEVELVAGEIKKLLVDGDPAYPGQRVSPGDIVVVVRSFTEYGDRIWEVFRDYGIPVYLESGLPLRRVGPIRALLSLVDLEWRNWPIRQLLAVLRHSYFRPKWCSGDKTGWLPGVELALRSCGVPAGRQAFTSRLRSLAENPPADAELLSREVFAQAKAMLEGLAMLLGQLSTPARWCEWVNRFAAIVDECGLNQPIGKAALSPIGLGDDNQSGKTENLDSASSSAHTGLSVPKLAEGMDLVESRAWSTFWSACDELANFYRRLDRDNRPISLAEVVETLRRLTEGWRVLPVVDEIGRVRVLSPSTARAVKVPYVFILGLVQGTFPAAVTETTGWEDTELDQLAKAGVDTAPVVSRLEEEMLLFYQLVTRASRRVVLCYPGADKKGEPILTSPFVHEVELAFGGPGVIPRFEPKDLTPIPRSPQPMSQAQWRILAIDRARRGDFALLRCLHAAAPDSPAVHNILHGLLLREKRDRFGVFSEFEGMIGRKSLRGELDRVFSWDRPYSPTELENYVACPFRYLIRDRLRIEPVTELVVATDFLRRGQRFHEAICRFHKLLQAQLNDKAGLADLEQISADVTKEMWDQSFDPPPGADAAPLDRAAYELDRQLWQQLREVYFQQWRNYDDFCRKQFGGVLAPLHFEVWIGNTSATFGGKDQAKGFAQLPLENKRKLLLTGRVDRIDVGTIGSQKVYAVVDYKLSRSSPVPNNDWKENIQQGLGLQLALYLFAVKGHELLDQSSLPLLAGYWLLNEKGLAQRHLLWAGEIHASGRGKSPMEVSVLSEWQEIVNTILPRTCLAIVRAMRKGAFPPAPRSADECDNCPVRTICRVAECRAYDKTWSWQDAPDKPEAEEHLEAS